MSESSTMETGVTAALTLTGLAVDVTTNGGLALRADEPEALGGGNTGPDPFSLLFASLASCILITVRMYAQRKGWDLAGADIRVFPVERNGFVVRAIEYELDLKGDLDENQIQRLQDVAHKCPVHRSIEASISVHQRANS